MEQKHAVITGAAGGIGRGLVAGLLEEGWHVAALDRDAEALAALPGAAQRAAVDLADEEALAEAWDRIGWDRVDLLVNCAGIAGPHNGDLAELTLAHWREVLDSHLTAAFLTTRAVLPALRAAGGSVVHISSTRARMSEPHSEAYAAAKGGIEALTHAMALSLGPEVRVNCVAPGWIVTGDPEELSEKDHAQHPAGRAGLPEDIWQAVRYLAQAGFVTGEVLTVDGGMTRKMIYV